MIRTRRIGRLLLVLSLTSCDSGSHDSSGSDSSLVDGYYQLGAMIPMGADTIRGSGDLSIEVTSDTTFIGEYSLDDSLASVLGQSSGRILEGSIERGLVRMRFGGTASTGQFEASEVLREILRGTITSASFGTEESFGATLTRTRVHLAGDYVFDLRFQRGSGGQVEDHGIVLGLLSGTEVDANTLQLRGKLAVYERKAEGEDPYTRVGDLEEVDHEIRIDSNGGFSVTMPIFRSVDCAGEDYRSAGFFGTCDFGGVDSQINFGLRRIVPPLRLANVPMAGRDTLGGSRHLQNLHGRVYRNDHAQAGLTSAVTSIGFGDLLYGGPASHNDSVSHTYVPVLGSHLLDTLTVRLPGLASRMASHPAGGSFAATAGGVYHIDEASRRVDILLPRDTSSFFPSTRLFGLPFSTKGIIAFSDTVVTVEGERLDTLKVPGLAGTNPTSSFLLHAAWSQGESSVLWTIASRTEEGGEEDARSTWREIAFWDGNQWHVERLELETDRGFPLSTNQYLAHRSFCPDPDRPIRVLDRTTSRWESNCSIGERKTKITIVGPNDGLDRTVVDREMQGLFRGYDGNIYERADDRIIRLNADYSLGDTIADMSGWPEDQNPRIIWTEVFADGDIQAYLNSGILLTSSRF